MREARAPSPSWERLFRVAGGYAKYEKQGKSQDQATHAVRP